MSQNLYTLSKPAIEYLCNCINKLASVSEAIDNTNLADDKVFSNLYTKKLIDKCLEDANTEAQKLVGALTHLTCEETTVQPTLDNSSINVIYLYSATGNAPYQQYLKISDTKLIDLGSTSVSLSAYLTATEIARDYITKLDFDALKTEVKGKVDKTSILTTIDNLATDDQVYSAKATYDLANTKANTNHTHTASDITDLSIPTPTTIINSSSTDTEFASTKAVYDSAIKEKNIKTFTVLAHLGLEEGCSVEDIFLAAPISSLTTINVTSGNVKNVPSSHGVLIILKRSTRFSIEFKASASDSVYPNELYIGQLQGSDGSGLVWNKVITDTDIANLSIPSKTSELENDSNYLSTEDIIDNLTSTDTNKLLSANQGKILNDTKLNKTDANKLNCVVIDNVSLKEYILTNFTVAEGKKYHLIANTTCTDLPKASNFYITVETPGLYTYKVTAKELNDSNGKYVCTYRTLSSSWTAWEKVLITGDITTTISDSSTDTQVPSAKAVYDELQEVFQSVSNGKNLIASAITDKGVDTLADATFKQMADNIGMISGGNVNEHVEKIKVSTMPVMSNYTSDEGEVIFSSEQNSYKAYYVFNSNEGNFWLSENNKTTDEWIGVKYTTPQIITEISILNPNHRNVYAIKNYRVEASNDGVDYDVLYVGENTNNTELSEWSITFGNDKEYLYYRLCVIDGFITAGVGISKMSLKKDAIVSISVKGTPLIPKMTSNTAPSGIASASSSYGSYAPYKAFGKNYPSSSDMWMSNVADFSLWIQYEFDAPQIVKKVGVYQSVISDTKAHALKTYELLGSNDGTTFDSLGYGGALQAELGAYKLNIFNNTKSYKIYRIRIIDVYNRTKQVYLGDIQLYG